MLIAASAEGIKTHRYRSYANAINEMTKQLKMVLGSEIKALEEDVVYYRDPDNNCGFCIDDDDGTYAWADGFYWKAEDLF